MNLDDLRAFIAVVEAGSVNGGSELLGLPRTTVRRRIEALDEAAGVPLLHRTAGGVHPTEAGDALLLQGRYLLESADGLLLRLRSRSSHPQGVLRVSVPPGMHPDVYAAGIRLLRSHFPDVQVWVSEHPRGAESLPGAADIAVVLGASPADDSHVAFTMIRLRVWLLASEEYLAQRGMPASVDDLRSHDLLAWESGAWPVGTVPLLGGGAFEVAPISVGRNIHNLRRCAETGLGIALIPDVHLPGSALRPVLPDTVGCEIPIWVVIPRAIAGLPKVRAVIDTLRALARAIQEGHIPQ